MDEPGLTPIQRLDLYVGGVIRRVILLMVAVPAAAIIGYGLASIWTGLPVIVGAVLLLVFLMPLFRGIRQGLR